jgi:hypothetical protein
MRLARSPIGVSSVSSTVQPAQPLMTSADALVFAVEIVVMLSLNRITFAVPLESTMAYIAAALATSRGSVVTLVKTGGSLIGPGVGAMCQPTILMPSIATRRMTGACSCVSTLPRMMPSGFSAIA